MDFMPTEKFSLYTDGATSNNGYDNATGGWAWALIKNDKEMITGDSGHINEATNNICELTALINGCITVQTLRAANVLSEKDVIQVYSDSAYCINCYMQKWYKKWQTNGWVNSKKQPVANRGLWEKLIPFFEDKSFNFNKVQGHSTNHWNNLVDEMAVAAKQEV